MQLYHQLFIISQEFRGMLRNKSGTAFEKGEKEEPEIEYGKEKMTGFPTLCIVETNG